MKKVIGREGSPTTIDWLVVGGHETRQLKNTQEIIFVGVHSSTIMDGRIFGGYR